MIADLVQAAVKAGAGFRLSGAQVIAKPKVTDPALLAQLRTRKGELWDYLGGHALDAPSLACMAEHSPNIRIVTPTTVAETLDIVARLEADADAQEDHVLKGVLALDIETQANAGEEIPQPVRIKRDGTVVQRPALDLEHLRRKSSPQSTAGLDPHRSTVRLAQLYGGGQVCLVLVPGWCR